MIGHLLLATSTFIITNIDDLLILSFYFGIGRFRTGTIVSGQFVGISILILVSLSGLLFRNLIPQEWIGLLGIFPIAIGIKDLLNTSEDQHSEEHATQNGLWKIALVTIANGGDNIAVYTPLFARTSVEFLTIYISVFLILTGVLCFLGFWFVNHPRIKDSFTKYGSMVMPYFLIALGLFIMSDLVR
jgi:cadmium resistance protein CadD (predicted permease)